MNKCLLIVLAIMTSVSLSAQAGVIIGGTRIIFKSNKKETSLNVSNPDNAPYLIQSWVDTQAGQSAPFIITPPLFRLDGKQQNVLRVVRAGGDFPADREVMYWANFKSIPATSKQENVLQVAIKTRIKLIVRPDSLRQAPEELTDKLVWQRAAGSIKVNNPTPYYMNFQSVVVNQHSLKDVGWVAPFASKTFALPSGVGADAVTWRIISDYGAIGPEHHATL
ncbi:MULTISPECIES: fimbrial biogenesis chaperone [Tenebrionibacter/Tenebrionicola group]|jgi:P pilus assembly chaperone PapD|uniref:Molecular chaperone n=2 Tax=Tenebrionibacter/Tenebrionicola group TaxID=2969848 RepID=A0A8K0V9N4_9ENTR|nr:MULTISPECIES: molecular chaperone [Tenebrionibacter/Tenebrionicola group]MBK4716862.1 molecular chaperone [Tenebrionibacter intestinalis]MBV5097448.1 molecular chaperone [Tenebrionicola larvae]